MRALYWGPYIKVIYVILLGCCLTSFFQGMTHEHSMAHNTSSYEHKSILVSAFQFPIGYTMQRSRGFDRGVDLGFDTKINHDRQSMNVKCLQSDDIHSERSNESNNGSKYARNGKKKKSSQSFDSQKLLQNANVKLHLSSQDNQTFKQRQTQTNNRRQFFSSVLISSAIALIPPSETTSSSQTLSSIYNAYADEITWSPSPINKRSGITVYKAEETYNIQFITYLSRFLLSFDEECQKWWYKRASDIPKTASLEQVKALRLKQFGSFAASVEVGLQEYEFEKGSSNNNNDDAAESSGPQRLMQSLLQRYGRDIEEIKLSREQNGLPPYKTNEEERVKGEIKEARRQIALLFGLLNTYQPVEEITKLLAAIDNASVQEIKIVKSGSGYAPGYGVPAVTFPPPDAGEGYETATGRAKLQPNGRILRVDVQKRGFGYNKPPVVTISPPMSEAFGSPFAKAATAKAFIFKDGMNKGRLERIELISPGSGYAEDEPIKVKFSPPDLPSEDGGEVCVGEAILEYEVSGIEIINPGTGYASEKPLQITVDPPPLTARVNLNDPMVVKNLSLDVVAKNKDSSSSSSAGSQVEKTKQRKFVNDDNIFDPSSMKSKAWKMAKIGGAGGCVGRACYDDPVVAYAYPVADANSYSSFRSNSSTSSNNSGGSRDKEKISAAYSGDEGYVPQMPFYSTTSSSLISLLPNGVGLAFNTELKRYELVAGEEAITNPSILAATPGKPIDTDFGPRGRSPIERERKLTSDIILRFFAAGALCCSSVHLVLTPLDVVKTNIQTDPEKYTNPFTAFNLLLEENGITALFAGWVPTFVGFFVNGGLSYAMTEFFRRFYFDLAGDAAFNYEIPIIVAAAATSAFLGVFTLTPSEAIRIRSVAQPDYAPNAFGVATRMVNEEGIMTLFSAVPVFMLKEIPFCIAKFTIFDVSTEMLYEAFPAAREDLQLSLLITLAGGTLGGISAAFVSNPADATVSAMKKAKSDDGPITTFKRLIEEGGVPAMFRGLGIRMFFYTLIVGLQFLVYDAIRFSFGVGTDDLKLYLDVLGGALRENGAPI